MKLEDMDPIDRAAMLVGTGLMFVGVIVLGLVEIIDGEPYGAAPITNDAGQVVAQPGVDPNIRAGLVVVGLVILLLWSVYKLAMPVTGAETTTSTETPAR